MSGRPIRYFSSARFLLGAALLAFPLSLFAQHGGGGRIGGSAAGGTGLSNGNHASGVDQKDDLKSFHDVMSVQASNEQAAAYRAMVKSTVAAEIELKALEAQVAKGDQAAAIAGRDKTLAGSLELARTLNKKFQEGFSSDQKSGLKIVLRRLGKTDAEVGQQARVVDQAVEANAAASVLTGSAQNLDHSLADFQRAQVDLGDEMSINTADGTTDFTFNLSPVKNPVKFANAAMTVTTSGVVTKGASQGGENSFAVQTSEDISDLQIAISDVLQAQLNKSDRCGERIEIHGADLTPRDEESLVVLQLHYERWTCGTSFGHESSTEIVEGDGTVEVILKPSVAEDGSLRLAAQVGHTDVPGLVGELLRSGSLGEEIRDKTSESVLAVVRQGGDFKGALPAAARGYASLKTAAFFGTGSGKLILVMSGRLVVPDDKVAALTGELGQASQVETVPGPLLTRPATAQDSVSR